MTNTTVDGFPGFLDIMNVREENHPDQVMIWFIISSFHIHSVPAIIADRGRGGSESCEKNIGGAE